MWSKPPQSTVGVDHRHRGSRLARTGAGWPSCIHHLREALDDPVGERTYGITYIKTSENGAILDSDEDSLNGDSDFLDIDTEEQERELMYDDAGDDDATFYGMHSNEAIAISAGGIAIEAHTSIAVKRGNLKDGNGLYGPGNVCIFTGDLTVTSD